MRDITFALIPGMLASSLTLPLEMLNAADNIHRSREKQAAKLKIRLAGNSLNPVASSGGLMLTPDCLYEEIATTDLFIIPGIWRTPVGHMRQNTHLVSQIRRLYTETHTTLCAVSTGSILLAESGLLNGRAATTHWFLFRQMKQLYPKVNWKKHHLITQSDNIYCAGSINSIADLTIRFIELGFSKAIARRVESQFSPEIRKGIDQYLFEEGVRTRHNDEAIAGIQGYIQKHHTQTLDFRLLADEANMSYRNFIRRFKQATQFTPLQYQQALRVQSAKELLKESDLNIQDVTEMVGYVDASHFAGIFKRHTEQTPRSFREAVRAKLFNP